VPHPLTWTVLPIRSSATLPILTGLIKAETFKKIVCGVSKKFGECDQKTNKTEDTNKLNLLAF
jgi:hypothetical protein